METHESLNAMKQSVLLRVAIEAAITFDRLVDSNDRYEWDMGVWYRVDMKCRACMAGAVMHANGLIGAPRAWALGIDRMRSGHYYRHDSHYGIAAAELRFWTLYNANHANGIKPPSNYLTWLQYSEIAGILAAQGH